MAGFFSYNEANPSRQKARHSMSIFNDEWRKCLQEHYQDVIRRDDKVTLPSLRHVLLRVGFTADDLKDLYMRATMHADDLPEGFMPDLSAFDEDTAPTEAPALPVAQQEEAPARTFTPHPAECTCPSCMDAVDETRHDDEGQPLAGDALREAQERLGYVQKTLF